MSDQHTEGEDLDDPFAEAAKPRGTMSTRHDDPEGGSMAEAFAENTEELGRGENPLAQGQQDASDTDTTEDPDTTEDENPDGHAGVFSPGRTDQPS